MTQYVLEDIFLYNCFLPANKDIHKMLLRLLYYPRQLLEKVMDQIKTLEQALKYIQVQQRENSIATRYQYELQDECEQLKQLSQELAQQLEHNSKKTGSAQESVRYVLLEEKNQELDQRLTTLINVLNNLQTSMDHLQTEYNDVQKQYQQIKQNISGSVPADKLITKLNDLSSHIELQNSQIKDLKIRNAQLEVAEKQLMRVLMEKQQQDKQIAELESLKIEYDNSIQLISNQGIIMDQLKNKLKQLIQQNHEYQEKISQLQNQVYKSEQNELQKEQSRALALSNNNTLTEEYLNKLEEQKKIMKEIMTKQLDQENYINSLESRLEDFQVVAIRNNFNALKDIFDQSNVFTPEHIYVTTILRDVSELFQVVQENQMSDKKLLQQYEAEIQKYRTQMAEINILNKEESLEQKQLQNKLENRAIQYETLYKRANSELKNQIKEHMRALSDLEVQLTQIKIENDKIQGIETLDHKIKRLETVKSNFQAMLADFTKETSEQLASDLVKKTNSIIYHKIVELRVQLSNQLMNFEGYNDISLQTNDGITGEINNITSLVQFARQIIEIRTLESQTSQQILQTLKSSKSEVDELFKQIVDEKNELKMRVLKAEVQSKDVDAALEENKLLKEQIQQLHDQLQLQKKQEHDLQLRLQMSQLERENMQKSINSQDIKNIQTTQMVQKSPLPAKPSSHFDITQSQKSEQVKFASLNSNDLKRSQKNQESPKKEFFGPMSMSITSPITSQSSAMIPGSHFTVFSNFPSKQCDIPTSPVVNSKLVRLTQNVLNGRNILENDYGVQNSMTDKMIQIVVNPQPK